MLLRGLPLRLKQNKVDKSTLYTTWKVGNRQYAVVSSLPSLSFSCRILCTAIYFVDRQSVVFRMLVEDCGNNAWPG